MTATLGILICCATLLLLQIVAVRALRAPTSAAHPMCPVILPDDATAPHSDEWRIEPVIPGDGLLGRWVEGED